MENTEILSTEKINNTTVAQPQKHARQSNFELLRIFSMLLIISHHFVFHGIDLATTFTYEANLYITRALAIGGKLGVNIFVLISGYFLITSKFSFKKLLTLICQVIFYRLGTYLILLACGAVPFTFSELFHSITPILSNRYWFIPCYVIMYILSPYLNSMLKNITKKSHLILIIFLVVLQGITPKIFTFNFFSNVGWFLTLYIIAAYIRLYPNKFLNNNKIIIPIALCSLLFITLMFTFANIILWDQSELICVICAVSIICWYKNINIKNSKIINILSSTTFGIYLFHDNTLLYNIIWEQILHCKFHAQLPTYVLFAIVAILTVFVMGAAIDLIRQLIFKGIKKLNSKLKVKKEQT